MRRVARVANHVIASTVAEEDGDTQTETESRTQIHRVPVRCIPSWPTAHCWARCRGEGQGGISLPPARRGLHLNRLALLGGEGQGGISLPPPAGDCISLHLSSTAPHCISLAFAPVCTRRTSSSGR